MEQSKLLEGIILVRYSDKKSVRLCDLWNERPVLLCLFRRWGCSVCRMSAANIDCLKFKFDEHGVDVVGVGVTIVGIEEFVKNHFHSEVLIDVNREAYTKLACQRNSWRNLWGLLSKDIRRLFKMSADRGYENNTVGDVQQFGGTLLFQKGGKCLYEHKQTGASFEPDLPKIVELLGGSIPATHTSYPVYQQK